MDEHPSWVMTPAEAAAFMLKHRISHLDLGHAKLEMNILAFTEDRMEKAKAAPPPEPPTPPPPEKERSIEEGILETERELAVALARDRE